MYGWLGIGRVKRIVGGCGFASEGVGTNRSNILIDAEVVARGLEVMRRKRVLEGLERVRVRE